MSQEETQITQQEANSALAALKDMKRDAQLSTRPPLWLNAISTALLGMVTISMALARHENLWFVVSVCGMVAFLGTLLMWFRHLYLKGVVPRFPSAWSLSLILQNTLFLGLILGTRYLHMRGNDWAPYVGASVVCVLYSVRWHYFPSNESLSEGSPA